MKHLGLRALSSGGRASIVTACGMRFSARSASSLRRVAFCPDCTDCRRCRRTLAWRRRHDEVYGRRRFA